MTDYKVSLDVYNGPLDLLLYLIRREEVDIYDIPIARITSQYIEYINLLEMLDPDGVSEYLVLLATLIEIKSRTLLPSPPIDDEESEDLYDPRMDLVRTLLEYKQFKDAARELGQAAEDQARRFPSRPVRIERNPGELELEEAQVWDLMAAFNRLMAEIGRSPAVHEVVYDDTPLALHADDIVVRLQREGGSISFERIFLGRSKNEIIGLFLALLELVRQKRVRAEQEGLFGLIVIHLIDATALDLSELETSAVPPGSSGVPAAPDEAESTDSANSADRNEAGIDLQASADEDDEREACAELDAIDQALDRVAGRLERDRDRRRAADVPPNDGTAPDGETP